MHAGGIIAGPAKRCHLLASVQQKKPRPSGAGVLRHLAGREVFRQGLSRHGRDRGCGLKGSAAKAIKFDATLDVRLPRQRVLLTPARGAYEANTAHCYEGLPLVWGTHIAYGFQLGT